MVGADSGEANTDAARHLQKGTAGVTAHRLAPHPAHNAADDANRPIRSSHHAKPLIEHYRHDGPLLRDVAGNTRPRPPISQARSPGSYHICGSIDAMRTTIDKAGRLVIPRSLRDRIGLAGGGEVELALDGAAVRVEPVAGSQIREDSGLLVIPATGTPITGAAVRELIDADRHGR